MKRSKRFASAVGSGYASVVALSLFSLISIPIAVHFLGREGFGVAATIVQITAFSQVLQLGVGPSVSRFIVDYRSSADARQFGSFVKTAFAIGAVQGGLLLCIAWSGSEFLSAAFKIPQSFHTSFTQVIFLTLCASAVGLLFNPAQQLLYASQRIDIINYISILAQGIATLVLVAGLVGGQGLVSYAIAAWVGSITNALALVVTTKSLRLMPAMQGLPVDLRILPSLARFSGNVMMVSLGIQLTSIAPAIVINRILGSAAMADWTVGTRLLQLGLQLTTRIPNATEPTLWEIYANQQISWVTVRLKQTLQIAGAVAAVISGVLLSLNGNFVNLWSGARVSWSWQYDFLGAAILLVAALAATWCMLPGITKSLGMIRYVYLGEAVGILSLLAIPSAVTSPAGVLLALLVSMLIVRLSYGIVRAHRDLGQPYSAIGMSALRPLLTWIAIMPIALAARYLLQDNRDWFALVLWSLASAAACGLLAYAVGIPARTKSELRELLSISRNQKKGAPARMTRAND